MPLFFIISGVFLKPLSIKDSWNKYSKAYLKPYAIICLLMFIGTFCLLILEIVKSDELLVVIKRVAFGSGSNEDKALFHDVPTVGASWFLLALFWGRVCSSEIKRMEETTFINPLILSSILFFIGYISAMYIRLPLSFQVGLCAVPYILIGGLIKQYSVVDRFNEIKKSYVVLMIIVWLFVIVTMGDGLNMASCRYSEGIVRIPISIFASVCLLHLCHRYKLHMFGGIKWLGENTLYILAGHQIFRYFAKLTNFETTSLTLFLYYVPLKLLLEFFIEVMIAFTIGITIKKLGLFK